MGGIYYNATMELIKAQDEAFNTLMSSYNDKFDKLIALNGKFNELAQSYNYDLPKTETYVDSSSTKKTVKTSSSKKTKSKSKSKKKKTTSKAKKKSTKSKTSSKGGKTSSKSSSSGKSGSSSSSSKSSTKDRHGKGKKGKPQIVTPKSKKNKNAIYNNTKKIAKIFAPQYYNLGKGIKKQVTKKKKSGSYGTGIGTWMQKHGLGKLY